MTFVLKSKEWSPLSGCKPDTVSFTMNGKSLINPAGGSVSVCDVPKLPIDSQFQLNWRYNGVHGFWEGAPVDSDAPCPNGVSYTLIDKQYDFVISLKDSGTGEKATTMYIGKKSMRIGYCD
jgi:hypothetical protein